MSTSNHDLATGMLEGYVQSMIDPHCSAVAVKASANTAILIFRTLNIISAADEDYFAERLRRTFERRQGRTA